MNIKDPLHYETPAEFPATTEVKPFDYPVDVVTGRAKDFLALTKLPLTISSLLLFKNTAIESIISMVADEIRGRYWGSAWCDILEAVLVYTLHGQPRSKGTIEDFADELGKDHKLALFTTFCELYEDFTSRMLPPLMVVEVDPLVEAAKAAEELMSTPTSGGVENLVTESFLSYLMGCLVNPVSSPNLNQLASIRSEAIFKKPLGEFYKDLNELLLEIGFSSEINKDNLAHCWLNNQLPQDTNFEYNPTNPSVFVTRSRVAGEYVTRFFKKYKRYLNKPIAGDYNLPIPFAFRTLLRGVL